MSGVCNAAEDGHLEVLKYLREEVKAPWDSELPNGRLKMVIFTYSNTLLSVSMINIANMRVSCGRERPLRLFEVLTRNRQSALGLSRPYETLTRTNTPNVYNTSSTTTVLSQTVGDTNMALYIHLRSKTYIHTERVKQRERYKTRVIRATRLKIYSY